MRVPINSKSSFKIPKPLSLKIIDKFEGLISTWIESAFASNELQINSSTACPKLERDILFKPPN